MLLPLLWIAFSFLLFIFLLCKCCYSSSYCAAFVFLNFFIHLTQARPLKFFHMTYFINSASLSFLCLTSTIIDLVIPLHSSLLNFFILLSSCPHIHFHIHRCFNTHRCNHLLQCFICLYKSIASHRPKDLIFPLKLRECMYFDYIFKCVWLIAHFSNFILKF